LAGRHPHLDVAWHREPEDVLGVVGHARGIALPPYRIDFVDVLQVPRLEAVFPRIDAGFLGHLAHRGLLERLARVLAAGDGLPEAGPIGALEQQDLELHGVDDDERRDRNLESRGAHATRMRAVISASALKYAWGMSRVRWLATGTH